MKLDWKIGLLWFGCLMIIIAAVAVKISRSMQETVPVPVPMQSPPSSRSQKDVRPLTEKTEPTPAVTKRKVPVRKPEPTPAVVTATAYLIGNVQTGKIYAQKNSTLVLPVASMSKLITAVAATDKFPQSTVVKIAKSNMDVVGETSDLRAGEKYPLNDMLYPLLLSSSNVAAEALASTTNRTAFLELMSSYAWEIGMPSTFFADPSGLSVKNISTASDYFALIRYMVKSRSDILSLTKLRSKSVATTTDHGSHVFVNTHPFAGQSDFLGGKTGHTPAAKDTMISVFEIEENPVAIIVLGSQDRKSDTMILKSQAQKMIRSMSE